MHKWSFICTNTCHPCSKYKWEYKIKHYEKYWFTLLIYTQVYADHVPLPYIRRPTGRLTTVITSIMITKINWNMFCAVPFKWLMEEPSANSFDINERRQSFFITCVSNGFQSLLYIYIYIRCSAAAKKADVFYYPYIYIYIYIYICDDLMVQYMCEKNLSYGIIKNTRNYN